jgi:hypothetical protein
MEDSNWTQRRAFLFSHPRTASNLLTRILSGQMSWCISDYHFFDAFQYARNNFNVIEHPDQPAEDVRAEHGALLRKGHEQLAQAMASAAQLVPTEMNRYYDLHG